MKKTLSRYGFYVYVAGLGLRLLSRFIGMVARLYWRSLRESQFNFALVHSVFLPSRSSLVVSGRLNSDYQPYMTETLLLVLRISEGLKDEIDCVNSYNKKLLSNKLTAETMHGKLVDVLFSSVLNTVDELAIPFHNGLSLNEICAAIFFEIPVDHRYFLRDDVIDKVMDCRITPDSCVDSKIHHKIAQALIGAGQPACKWAKDESIDLQTLEQLLERGDFPPFRKIRRDDNVVALWASMCPYSACRSINDQDTSELSGIAKAIKSSNSKLSRALFETYQIEWLKVGINEDIVSSESSEQEVADVVIFEKGWRNKPHAGDLDVINKMLKSENDCLKHQAMDILRKSNNHHLIRISQYTKDEDILLMHFKATWNYFRDKLEDDPFEPILPRLIREEPKLVCKYSKLSTNSKLLVGVMLGMKGKFNIPRSIQKSNIKTLFRRAIHNKCPYSTYRISQLPEDKLLEEAKAFPEYEMIFNYCQSRTPENLGRYPDRLKDRNFIADLGL